MSEDTIYLAGAVVLALVVLYAVLVVVTEKDEWDSDF